MEQKEIFDVIIIGGGPAGMTSALYTLRAGMKTLLIEGASYGGQIVSTYEIKNYPGFIVVNGADLASKMHEQISELGIKDINDTVIDVELNGEIKTVKTAYSGTFLGKTVILSMGASARKLGLPDEEKLSGAGVSYCAICDGAFFKDKTVAVVGGGNTAIEDFIYLSKIAKKLYLIHRSENFRADKISLDSVEALAKEKDSKVEFILNSSVTKLYGETMLTGIEVTNAVTLKKRDIQLDGIFIAIGRAPSTNFLKGKIELNDYGYIKTDEHMKTSIEGVYAAGDVRVKDLRQIITATADGAIAATQIGHYIGRKNRR